MNSVANILSKFMRYFRGLVGGKMSDMRRGFHSSEYWEMRYRNGGTSGSGSYGRLAKWKAQVLNDFVDRQQITRVMELGSGDGNQLSLATYIRYLGFDVSETAVKLCAERFSDRDWEFHPYSRENVVGYGTKFDPQLVISLDVIFHLVEDQVFDEYMRSLFSLNPKFIVIYSSNGNFQVQNTHVRNWVFTDWMEKNAPEWTLIDRIQNPYPWDASNQDETSFADFYIFRKPSCRLSN